jgi:hypothetical protein
MTTVRNAAGRFVPAPAEEPKARTAGERLQAAKDAVPKLERARDAVMARRRECLLNDDVAGRRRCDDQLRELRDDLQAAHDKAELLGRAGPGVVPAPQQQGWTWPSSLADANQALLDIQPELLRLRSIAPNDRHAGHDRDQDFLVNREYRLLRLIESMQPKNMTAA